MARYTAVSIDLIIILNTALHIGTGFGLAKLLDERTTQGSHPHPTYPVDLPYIPGASLKGRLRAQAGQLVHDLSLIDGTTLITDLFGTAHTCGRLVFPDVHLIKEDEQILAQEFEQQPGVLVPFLAFEERTHVALSRIRRSALENMLMRIEVAASGLHLTTTIDGWLPATQVERGLALLTLAICTTTHIGGHKGRGLGAVHMRPMHIKRAGESIELAALWEAL